eukprot:330452-Rhodomonas_salina.1
MKNSLAFYHANSNSLEADMEAGDRAAFAVDRRQRLESSAGPMPCRLSGRVSLNIETRVLGCRDPCLLHRG